jgi:hypothetical protein
MNSPFTTLEIQRMPNVTIYVPDKDVAVWKKAKRLLRFHDDMGLASYVTPVLQRYVEKREGKED